MKKNHFIGLTLLGLSITIVTLAFISKKLNNRKPGIEINSIIINSLFRNCVHEMTIEVPELGENYNPSFKCVGCEVYTTEKKGTIRIMPTSIKPELKIYNDTTYLGSKFFSLKLIPYPTVFVKANDQFLDEKVGLKISEVKTISVKINPDESFRAFLPKDARYKTTGWNCSLMRGRKELNMKKFTDETGDVSEILIAAKEGDRLMIEVTEATRKNGLDKTEVANIGKVIKNIPLY